MCMVRIRDDTVSNMFQASQTYRHKVNRQMDHLANKTETNEKVFKCLDNKGQKTPTRPSKEKNMPWQELKEIQCQSGVYQLLMINPKSSANLWSNLSTSWIASKRQILLWVGC